MSKNGLESAAITVAALGTSFLLAGCKPSTPNPVTETPVPITQTPLPIPSPTLTRSEMDQHNRLFSQQLTQEARLDELQDNISTLLHEPINPSTGKPWLTDMTLGTIFNQIDEEVTIATKEDGEPEAIGIDRPLPEVAFTTSDREKSRTISDGQNYLICYGLEFCSPTEGNAEITGQFLSDYFYESDAQYNVLHIDARTPGRDDYLDIGQIGKSPELPENASATNQFLIETESGKPARLDVILSTREIYLDSLYLGFDPNLVLTENLVNEKVDILSHVWNPELRMMPSLPSLEAMGTIAGMSVLADPENPLADQLLGPNHKRFVDLLAEEMQSQAQIVRR